MSLKREILISKLIRTPEQLEFHATHTLIQGIYDSDGLEGLVICDDWDTEDGLHILFERLQSYELRCRYNSQRNATSFIRWVTNENLKKIEKSIDDQDFILSKSLIINGTIKI
jgi:hypothetical protein